MLSSLVPLFKGKGDPLNPNSYKGIKLLEHTFKLYQFGKMQYGFMSERGTIDAAFVLRRHSEKFRTKLHLPGKGF